MRQVGHNFGTNLYRLTGYKMSYIVLNNKTIKQKVSNGSLNIGEKLSKIGLSVV